MKEHTWKNVELGAIVTEAGSASQYKTGDWRSQYPKYNQDRCVKCGICYLYCPDAAIKIKADGYIEVDQFYCKGCGICARECWTGAFEMLPEGSQENSEKKKEKKK